MKMGKERILLKGGSNLSEQIQRLKARWIDACVTKNASCQQNEGSSPLLRSNGDVLL